jgi:riboflavin synthase
MFTGIVTDIGTIRALAPDGDWRCEIACRYDPATIDIGASVLCAGVCLTVVARGAEADCGWFAVEVSEETRRATTLSGWRAGVGINLERSLRVGDELGGHIVLGHVDGVGEIHEISPENESLRFRFGAPEKLSPMIAEKGSIAIDGVSLTVNGVGANWFDVNIIPHTRKLTTFGARKEGDQVNLEVDVLARYVARLRGRP